MSTRFLASVCLALSAALTLSGCAAIPMSLALEGADAGMHMVSAESRSFTHSRSEVHTAVVKTLDELQIQLLRDREKGEKIKIVGKTNHLKIYLALEPITPVLTRVSIKVKKNWMMKDQMVAAEILGEIGQTLKHA